MRESLSGLRELLPRPGSLPMVTATFLQEEEEGRFCGRLLSAVLLLLLLLQLLLLLLLGRSVGPCLLLDLLLVLTQMLQAERRCFREISSEQVSDHVIQGTAACMIQVPQVA